jgi:nitroimidazol reductase NimA-like FMN-containing flavoprotein (pyridoxamine 5'-phosphate oxidase superfamily)
MTTTSETGQMNSEEVHAFLQKPHLARLATADHEKCRPHVVPVWYLWDGEAIWISSFQSTRKVRELEKNNWCSIVIDAAQSGLDYQSVLLEGKAELVTEPLELIQSLSTEIYRRYLGDEGVLAPDPQSWIHDPENLLIKLRPQKTRAWFSRSKPENNKE